MLPGMPLICFQGVSPITVNDQNDARADIRIYAKFKNPRLFGPSQVLYTAQSGIGAMAAGMVGSSILSNIAKPLMNSAADTMAHGFCEATGLCNTEQAEMFAQDLKSIGDDFLKPSSFMPSFFGDTIFQGPGPKVLRAATSQNSANIQIEEPQEHSILEFLKRPQYCGVVTNNTTQVVNNDVFAPFNSTPLNSWFAHIS